MGVAVGDGGGGGRLDALDTWPPCPIPLSDHSICPSRQPSADAYEITPPTTKITNCPPDTHAAPQQLTCTMNIVADFLLSKLVSLHALVRLICLAACMPMASGGATLPPPKPEARARFRIPQSRACVVFHSGPEANTTPAASHPVWSKRKARYGQHQHLASCHWHARSLINMRHIQHRLRWLIARSLPHPTSANTTRRQARPCNCYPTSVTAKMHFRSGPTDSTDPVPHCPAADRGAMSAKNLKRTTRRHDRSSNRHRAPATSKMHVRCGPTDHGVSSSHCPAADEVRSQYFSRA